MIKLDERLTAVAGEITPCNVLADIGSDHGKIAVYAVLNGLAKSAIASDISAKSAEKSQILADKEGVTISVRVGDGLATLNAGEYDTVVIAGMGGIEIADILSRSIVKFNRYILVPHSKPDVLRNFFIYNGLSTVKDYKVRCKGRFYDIIVAEIGEYCPSEREICYGKCIDSPCFEEYRIYETERLKSLLAKTDGAKRDDLKKKLALLDNTQ